MILSVEVPDPIARSLSLNGPSSTRRALEMLALEGYREGKLSRGQVSEMLDLEFNETEKFLRDNGAMLGLSNEDYERSNAALQKLLSR
jgi:predicted HTH domain antitoxin